MSLKILLIDPDQDWLESTMTFLKDQMYEIDIAQNGKSGQLAIYNNPYFAVVLNIQVKNHSGLEVLKFIKSNHTTQRTVVVVDNQQFLDNNNLTADKLIKFGATEVMLKPFTSEDLKDVLEGHQSLGDMVSTIKKHDGVREEEEVQESDETFTAIDIEKFYSSKSVLFDIYIKLASGRYIKILHAGDTFEKDRVDKYKNEKSVTHLYFHKNDRKKYIAYCNWLATKVVANENLPGQAKVQMMRNVADKFLEEAFSVGLKPQVIEQGKQICENVYQMIESEKNLHKLLKEYQEFDPTAYSHSFACTFYSAAIIKQFEWQSKTMIETMSMACLFHDIGKMKMPDEVANKRPEDMNEEELVLYKKHPKDALEMLDNHIMVNNSIKQVIYQHHEAYDGTGFPNGFKGNKVLTLANILCLVDDFIHVMIEGNLKPVEALKNILSDPLQSQRYNAQILENFIRVFADPEKLRKDHALPTNSRIVPNKKAS